jgi:hypothetical protein
MVSATRPLYFGGVTWSYLRYKQKASPGGEAGIEDPNGEATSTKADRTLNSKTRRIMCTRGATPNLLKMLAERATIHVVVYRIPLTGYWGSHGPAW